jgi:uncharacterized membrane protein
MKQLSFASAVSAQRFDSEFVGSLALQLLDTFKYPEWAIWG